MPEYYITYPIAYNRLSNQLVEIRNVTEGNRSYLICPMCLGNFIAVKNHRTPHFRHNYYRDCKGSTESYVHRLTKVLFKKLKSIEIPELLIDDLPEKKRQYFQSIHNKILDSNLPYDLQGKFRRGLKQNLNDSKVLMIDDVEIEKEFKTSIGDIRVDVVVTSQNEKSFIEPFYTNRISAEKKKMLAKIDVPTLSLNLSEFVKRSGSYFSIQHLKEYLYEKESKKWEYLGDKEYDKQIKNYEAYMLSEIEKFQPSINQHYLDEIKKLERECEVRKEDINDIQNEITEIISEIAKLTKKLKK